MMPTFEFDLAFRVELIDVAGGFEIKYLLRECLIIFHIRVLHEEHLFLLGIDTQAQMF